MLNSLQCSVIAVLWYQRGVLGLCAAGELCASHPGSYRPLHVLVTFFHLLGTSLSDFKSSFPAVPLKSLQYVGIYVEFLKRVGQIYFLAVPSVA